MQSYREEILWILVGAFIGGIIWTTTKLKRGEHMCLFPIRMTTQSCP
jgi:hypothetical protein